MQLIPLSAAQIAPQFRPDPTIARFQLPSPPELVASGIPTGIGSSFARALAVTRIGNFPVHKIWRSYGGFPLPELFIPVDFDVTPSNLVQFGPYPDPQQRTNYRDLPPWLEEALDVPRLPERLQAGAMLRPSLADPSTDHLVIARVFSALQAAGAHIQFQPNGRPTPNENFSAEAVARFTGRRTTFSVSATLYFKPHDSGYIFRTAETNPILLMELALTDEDDQNSQLGHKILQRGLNSRLRNLVGATGTLDISTLQINSNFLAISVKPEFTHEISAEVFAGLRFDKQGIYATPPGIALTVP